MKEKELRDEFAMAVAGPLAGHMTSIMEKVLMSGRVTPEWGKKWAEEEFNKAVASTAYQIADAMMAEREKKL